MYCWQVYTDFRSRLEECAVAVFLTRVAALTCRVQQLNYQHLLAVYAPDAVPYTDVLMILCRRYSKAIGSFILHFPLKPL